VFLVRQGVPRVVVVSRRSEYEELLIAQSTHRQAAFFLESRGRNIEELVRRDALQTEALNAVLAAIPNKWRRARIQRHELDRFLFEPGDVVVAVGQDGLVANTAKYLDGQTVLGVNPDPAHNEGVLARLTPADGARVVAAGVPEDTPVERRTMVEATKDDGQTLFALNEVFVGHCRHQSARYLLRWQGSQERHSSSGIIVSTGTGASGWARSVHRATRSQLSLPQPEQNAIVFFVREAWPSLATGTSLCEGVVSSGSTLEVISEMNQGGVAFGDGIEEDHLALPWAQRLTLRVASRKLVLVTGARSRETQEQRRSPRERKGRPEA
jgi:NAD kinase